jgi:tripartite-type tricarboxylate transporter receptor subunit TctC
MSGELVEEECMIAAFAARTAVAALLFGLTLSAAFAQSDWPNRPVKILLPFAPGGSADTLGRIVAQKLTEALGQQFVVESRPGAGGLIAAAETARAEPDGYTLTVSSVGATIIAPALSPKSPVHPLNDFTHIAYFGGPPTVLVVSKDLPPKTLKEFVDYAKAQPPGALNYGSPSPGSHGNLIGELFSQKAGFRMTHVSYKGASQAMKDLAGNHIQAASVTLTTASGPIMAGSARPLAHTGVKRTEGEFANIPTYKELGYDLVAVTWFALSGPAKMNPDIVRRLNAEVVKALKDPTIRVRLAREAIDPEPFDAAQFAAFFKAEYELWTPIARAAVLPGKK